MTIFKIKNHALRQLAGVGFVIVIAIASAAILYGIGCIIEKNTLSFFPFNALRAMASTGQRWESIEWPWRFAAGIETICLFGSLALFIFAICLLIKEEVVPQSTKLFDS